MPELNTLEFDDLVALGVINFIKGAGSVPNTILNSGIVKKVDIPMHSGNTRKFSELDTNEYLSYKAEGDQAARGKFQQGYSKIMYAKRMAENVGITFEMITQNKYEQFTGAFIASGAKGGKTIDRDLTHRLTFGTATSYTDADGQTIDTTLGDGLALFSTAHTLKGSTTTFRNILAANPRLSMGSIEQAERLVAEQTYNHLGELKNDISFDVLLTTADPNTVNTAREYLQSTASVEGTHAGIINVLKGKYRHVILKRWNSTAASITDTDKRYYWAIASTGLTSFFFGSWEAPRLITPKQGTNGEDIQTDNMDFRLRAGYGSCIVAGNWIKFSAGDGS